MERVVITLINLTSRVKLQEFSIFFTTLWFPRVPSELKMIALS